MSEEQKKTILVIEDDKFLSELLVGKLVAEGYNIDMATGGKEAVEKLSSVKPGLIILDLLLPDINGFEILEKMRKMPEHETTPVIVLSNLDQKEDMERAKSFGVLDFMIKANFSLTEIVARVKKVLP